MFRAYKYRIYPTNIQEDLINKHIGSVRFLYNLALETKQIAYAGNRINLSRYDLQKQLVELKKEYDWLTEVNSQSLQVALRNLDASYLSFFKGINKFPKYKSKNRNALSFSIPQNVKLDSSRLIIPKFKEGIKITVHREMLGIIKSATISRTPTGKYFASILVDTNTETPPKRVITEETTIGIDLGIKTFLVDSNGKSFDNPKHLRKAQSKLKYISRKYSKNKGKRTKHRLALLHEKVVNQRKDFLHKVCSELISENQTIAIENLNISGMLKSHNLAQSITDVSWGMFIDILKYKAEWNGVNILKIGRFDPSSKTCSVCGTVNKELTLKDREWNCNNCNSILDRDINAAINIRNFGLKQHLSVGCRLKNQKELPTLVGVMTSEAKKGNPHNCKGI